MNKEIKFPKRLSRTVVYESKWLKVCTDKVMMPSGKIIEKYHQLRYPNDSVVCLIKDEKGKICFIKSLRYTTQKVEWELPAGGIDKGETIIDAGKREIIEETNLTVQELTHQYSFNQSNGMSNQKAHIVKGLYNGQAVNKQIDNDEVVEIYWLDKEEILTLIENNDINDGISLVAIMMNLD